MSQQPEYERHADAVATLSRRKFLSRGAATAGIALAAILSACSGGGTSSSSNIATATSVPATKAATTAASTTPAGASTAGTSTAAATAARATPAGGGFSLTPAALTTVAGSPVSGTASASGGFDWQRFKGASIRVFVPTNPINTPLKNGLSEFEKLTGIKVNFEDLPENNAREKLTVEFTAGSSTIDVYASSLHQERLLFAKNGWYASLNDYLSDPKMTSPDFDWPGDFFKGVVDIMTVDGKVIGMPGNMDTNITFYRKDLFDQAGMKPPKTMDELEAAAKKFHNPPQMYGFVARGQKTSNATQIDPYFRNFGGGYFDKSGNPIMNSPEDIKAVEFYAMMLTKYGPPGVTNFSWPEASALFQQGRVALYTDGTGFAGPFEDKTKSTVAGKMGYGIFPAGPAGNFPPLFASSWAIYAKSKNKDAAWYFCQWAANKANTLKILQGGTSVGRISAWNNPESRSGSPLSAEWFESTFAMLQASVPGLPPVIHVAESRDIISVGVIDVINGKDAKTVMDRVQQELKALVDREKAGG